MTTLTPTYIASLVIFSGIIFIAFHGYGRAFGKWLPALKNIVGGFICFLAVNEVVALPFIVFHWSFRLFFPIFIVLNGTIFFFGVVNLILAREQISKVAKRNFNPAVIMAVFVMLFCAFITQVYVRYEADDGYYVGLVQQSLNSEHLYAVDPATNNPGVQYSPVHKFESWELLEAGIAKSFGLTSLEVTHGLMALVTIPLAFLASLQVFKIFFRSRNKIAASLVFLGIILLFSGYSSHSQGTFLLSRAWLGKAVLATIIIPFLFYLFLKLSQSKSNALYTILFIVSVASIALNPASIFVVGVALGAFAVQLALRQRSILPVLKLIFAALPLLAVGGGIFLLSHASGRSAAPGEIYDRITQGTFTWGKTTTDFFNKAWYYCISLVGLLILLKHKLLKIRRNTKSLVFFTIILGLVVMNPLLFDPISKFTGTTYWRLFWLIPMILLLPVLCVVVTVTISQKLKPAFRGFGRTLLLMLVGLVLALSGSWIFDTSKPIVARDTSRQKLPPGVSGVLEYMSTQPPGNTVATAKVAAYYHTMPTKQRLFISRSLYFQYYCGHSKKLSCTEQWLLFEIASGRVEAGKLKTANLLKKYQVDYLVINNHNNQFAVEHKTIFKDQRYKVLLVSS